MYRSTIALDADPFYRNFKQQSKGKSSNKFVTSDPSRPGFSEQQTVVIVDTSPKEPDRQAPVIVVTPQERTTEAAEARLVASIKGTEKVSRSQKRSAPRANQTSTQKKKKVARKTTTKRVKNILN
jgi:hypothetical protein